MTSTELSPIAIIFAYILMTLLIAIIGGRKNKAVVDFLLSNRSLGPVLLAFSYTTTYFSSAAFLGGGGMGFLLGFQWSTFLFFFHILFAVLAWALIAPKIKQFADLSNSMTVSEFLGTRYSSRALQLVSALVFIMFMEFYLISIFKGAGNILQVLLEIPYYQALLIVAVPALLYASIGGFRGNVAVSLLQGVLMISSALVLMGGILLRTGGWEDALSVLNAVRLSGWESGISLLTFPGPAPSAVSAAGATLPYILSLTFAISFAQMTSPHMVVQFYSARDASVIRVGRAITPILIAVFAFAVFFAGPFGWAVISDPAAIRQCLANPDLVMPSIAVSLFGSGFGSLLLVPILAAAMSTLAPICIMLSGSLLRDVISAARPKASGRVFHLRFATVLFGAVPLMLALNPPDIIVGIVGVAFSAISSAFFAPLIGGLYLKRGSRLGAIASVISAALTCIIWQLYFYSSSFIYPIIPGLLVGILVYLIFNAKVIRNG
ncbi:MAG: sodium/proline symporter [Candidatus Methanosuratincola petrocarbonis]